MIKIFLKDEDIPLDFVGKGMIIRRGYQIIGDYQFINNQSTSYSVFGEFKNGFVRRE